MQKKHFGSAAVAVPLGQPRDPTAATRGSPPKAAMRSYLLAAAAVGGAARITKTPPPLPRSLHVRGGGIFGQVARDAIEASSIKERTDIVATPLAATRTAVGALLLFRPTGATAAFGPQGVAAFQLFYVSHFYLRLAVKAVAKVDFFERAKTPQLLWTKRATSASIAALSCAAVLKIPEPTRLAPGLAWGVLVARSATSVFDHATAEIIERLRIGQATREILSPEHAFPGEEELHDLFSLDPHHHHRKSVKDAAESARKAVAATITRESVAAERARHAHGLSLKIQIARTLIAVVFTAGGLRAVSTGVWPLPVYWASRAPPPSVLALYAPAVVGAFELTAGIGDLAYVHKYQLERLALKSVGFVGRHSDLILGPAVALVTGVQKAGADAAKTAHKIFPKRRTVKKRKKGPPNPLLTRTCSIFLAPLLYAKKALSLGVRYYGKGVKFSKERVKRFVSDTHHDLWPWVVGRAGYLVQCGELGLVDVPKYLLNMASAPVLWVTVLAAKGAQALLAPVSRHPWIEKVLKLVIR